MPPFLLAILISSFVFGVGTLSYSPPKMHSPTIYKFVKDESRVINVPWPVRVVKVETYRYDPQIPKPVKKAKKKKKVRYARR